jgi:hypothetical protein
MKKVFVPLLLLLCVQDSTSFANTNTTTTSIQGQWKKDSDNHYSCHTDKYCHCVTVTTTSDDQDVSNPPNGISNEVTYTGIISADPADPNGYIIGPGDFSLWDNGTGLPVIKLVAYDGPNNTAGTVYIVHQVSISADYPKTITFLQ